MKIEEIKQLVELMVENDLTELNITDGDAKVTLKRGPEGVPVVTSIAPVAAVAAAGAPGEGAAPAEAEVDDGLNEIRCPMVGTFYAAASPDSDSFVSVGDTVTEDTVVCVVEAMKVMNEIKAECAGTITEICATNAQPMEFGQVLFRVKPL
jgi:acetyl-CoA carboxylase biotin carboxyl carrier protein